MPRRLVVASYYWPPSTSVGGARWAAMARHLRSRGHDVRVLTTALHGSEPDDAANGVVRSGDLAAQDWLRRALRRPGAEQAGSAARADTVTPAPALLTKVLVPDSYLAAWLPWAAVELLRMLRARPADCVVTTGPPSSAHLLGFLAGSRGAAWIADFRDGWRFEPPDALRWPTRAQDRLDSALERAVARRAERSVGVTRPIAEDLAERLGARAEWVPNGWDPTAAGQVAAAGAPREARREGWATLVHTGTLSGPWGRDPGPLLRAIREVNGAPAGNRVRLVLAGRLTSEDERLLSEAELGEAVEHLGLLERPRALALQQAADALVLLTSDNRSEATGKLAEYIHSDRPILAIANGNEAARIIEETETGRCLARHDHEGLVAALRDIAEGKFSDSHSPRGLERFTYPEPALRIESLVEEALAERARARGRRG